jgi:hypothetical protein
MERSETFASHFSNDPMTISGVGTGWLSNFTACSNTTLSIEFRENTLLAMRCFEQNANLGQLCRENARLWEALERKCGRKLETLGKPPATGSKPRT